MSSSSRITAIGTAIALLFVGGACQRGPDPETQAKFAELTKVSTQRDRLVQELAENARMMSEISVDLAKVRVPAKSLKVSTESPLGAARDSVVQQIRYVTSRVNVFEQKLRASEERIRDLNSLSDSLRATLEATITNYDSVIGRQRADIASLTAQVWALTDTVNHLNVVYYVAGTTDELLQRGIVVREGGSRFPLLIAKVGQVLVPARQLDPKAFTPIDKRMVTEIPLPEAGNGYRIASRQNLDGLATPPTPNGRVTGSVKIADPDRFWRGSRFLILVRS
jgi:hypothetical protein